MEDQELAYAICICDMMTKIVIMNIKLFSSNELDVLNIENIAFKSADHPLTSWNENIYSLTTAFKNFLQLQLIICSWSDCDINQSE